MKWKYILSLVFTVTAMAAMAQRTKNYSLSSPDGKVQVQVAAGPVLQWSVKHGSTTIIAPSVASITLAGGEVLGKAITVINAKTASVNTTIATPVYKRSTVKDHYNALTLECKGGYGIIFRAYNDGVAYRFFINRHQPITIAAEEATFNFEDDYKSFVPYVRDLRVKGDHFISSFEALYDEDNISQFVKDTLGFLPILVAAADGKKAVITEAHVEGYPGMYVALNKATNKGYKGVFAPYPLQEKAGGFNNMNYIVTQRADYLAQKPGNTQLPWRVVVISSADKELADNDMVYKLGAPSRVKDAAWIKPGKVAWDWWNDWNISGVDFKAGINTPTYKYYIDFAAAHGIEYIVMDEGWSVSTDITKISDKINLEELVSYGKSKGVDIILWATWYALNGRLDEVFAQYSQMGIKGFKIDFLDRDDAKMTASVYEIAQKAAAHKLLIDLHGMYKPDGLQRTYPNVINFEGVKGLENAKWTPDDDVPRYDVSIPFIRMVAGPMDYTPGALRNASKSSFRAIHSAPMSMGTRCHQLAMYVVFEAPLQMLADNPTAYYKEAESTQFIAQIPTVFDQTVALQGAVGEYVAIARRKGDTWYIGALTNWQARELPLSFSFLEAGTYSAEIFKDGVNADKQATDYKREVGTVTASDSLTMPLQSGGGWAAIIKKVK